MSNKMKTLRNIKISILLFVISGISSYISYEFQSDIGLVISIVTIMLSFVHAVKQTCKLYFLKHNFM